MKAVRLDSNSAVALMADSACRPDRRMPLFVPDGSWTIEVRPAVRVGRLGKAMTPQFAPRHIDGWALVAYLRPEHPSALADMIDDGLCTGLWQSVENVSDAPMGVKIDDHTIAINLRRLTNAGAEALASLSQAATFKTGDIIVLPEVIHSQPAVPSGLLSASLGDNLLLDLVIK